MRAEHLGFDRFQFDPRFRPDDIRGHGIDWGDLRAHDSRATLRIDRHAAVTHRNGGVPLWLYTFGKIRLVLAQVIWDWIIGGKGGDCPPLLRESWRELRRAADVHWARYIEMNGRTKEGRGLKRAVEKCGGILNLLVAILWRYRLGANSCEIADATGLTPVAVRIRLHRLNLIARQLFPHDCCPTQKTKKPPARSGRWNT